MDSPTRFELCQSVTDAEDLAHKTLRRCNSSSDSSRTLVVPLRVIRNVLGDIDTTLQQSTSASDKGIAFRSRSADNERLEHAITSSYNVLKNLEKTLLYRRQDVEANKAILGTLRISIHQSTQSLIAAHESVKRECATVTRNYSRPSIQARDVASAAANERAVLSSAKHQVEAATEVDEEEDEEEEDSDSTSDSDAYDSAPEDDAVIATAQILSTHDRRPHDYPLPLSPVTAKSAYDEDEDDEDEAEPEEAVIVNDVARVAVRLSIRRVSRPESRIDIRTGDLYRQPGSGNNSIQQSPISAPPTPIVISARRDSPLEIVVPAGGFVDSQAASNKIVSQIETADEATPTRATAVGTLPSVDESNTDDESTSDDVDLSSYREIHESILRRLDDPFFEAEESIAAEQDLAPLPDATPRRRLPGAVSATSAQTDTADLPVRKDSFPMTTSHASEPRTTFSQISSRSASYSDFIARETHPSVIAVSALDSEGLIPVSTLVDDMISASPVPTYIPTSKPGAVQVLVEDLDSSDSQSEPPSIAPSIRTSSDASSMSVDDMYVAPIVRYWNQRMWISAEKGLRAFFDELFQQNELPLARRVRHLLGVCLSYQGKLTQALDCFLSVLRTPVRDPRLFDDADSAACWWLGDTYAMLSMRKESWLAYSLAEKSPMFRLRSSGTLRWAIAAERKCIMENLPITDFQMIWAQQIRNPDLYKGTILHASIVPQPVALACLRDTPDNLDTRNFLLQKQNRAQCLLNSSKEHTELAWCNNASPERLHPTSFQAHTGWPMPFDPFFTMANVQQGRLQGQPCDLAELHPNDDATASNKGRRFGKPLAALENFDFTADSLPTLVRTLRAALQRLDIAAVEFRTAPTAPGGSSKKMGFLCGYPQSARGIASTYYFSLLVARSAKGGGGRWGVRVAPEGVCSARLVGVYDTLEFEKGVPMSEKTNVRRLVLECLDATERTRSVVSPSGGGAAAGRRLSTASIRSSVSSLAPILPKNGSSGGRSTFASSLFSGIGGRPYEIREMV